MDIRTLRSFRRVEANSVTIGDIIHRGQTRKFLQVVSFEPLNGSTLVNLRDMNTREVGQENLSWLSMGHGDVYRPYLGWHHLDEMGLPFVVNELPEELHECLIMAEDGEEVLARGVGDTIDGAKTQALSRLLGETPDSNEAP